MRPLDHCLTRKSKARKPGHPITRWLTQEEFGHLLASIDEYKGSPSTYYALRIIPYVFVRSSELRGARWEEIDFEKGEWTISVDRMKMKKPHIVPLVPQVVVLFIK